MSTVPPTGPAPQDGPTMRRAAPAFIDAGHILGSRYEVRRLLGRGAMGEVWLAYDLKLRVEVALKDLTFRREDREMLRREVRSARDVLSPNVCRVFDLVEAEERELLSMEYVDGVTLRQVIEERSPLDLAEAQTIASQLLAGLESIHAAGLVHRDVKPENVMITRTGRVVIMDFGLARESRSDSGSIAGTPAYMSPEQARGDPMDPRTDIFAVGVLLAELVTSARTREARTSIWEGIRRRPIEIPENPWTTVLRKALSRDRGERFASAREMARALEEITTRLASTEERNPYPGLSPFTSDQAKFFFGREAEVEAMLRRLERFHLLGLIGPSGAGKSSFLHAGVLPMLSKSWGVLRCHPGSDPFVSLGQALAPQLAGDADLASEMLRFHDVDVAVALLTRWRKRHDEGLLVIDQFEELFTLTSIDTQARFSALIGRLVDANIRVLLSLRDDFLLHCHEHEALAPVFSELTPLRAPAGAALRRALVQPAVLSGYRFENESLVEQMLEEVGSERGTLPLLAFAAARLWDKRDRDGGLLTRRAYDGIGGVSGALAQHAEETLDGIGADRIAIVREIFRNLVTAHGTRAARDRSELLSVFSPIQLGAAESIVDTLVAARLLISSEQGIEIVHESLLSAWPRLVHWQAQDAEGALMRDHLRQAAQLWEERGRAQALLWSGSAYREFVVWRSRYPGALSVGEETFARALVSNAESRKRQTRLAVASVLVVAIIVVGVLAVLLRRSAIAERRARGETQRAEAQKLLALSQVELERYPTAALAYATKSLEIADTPEARQRVMEILWRGPIARILAVAKSTDIYLRFSPDGRWLAATSAWGSDALVPSDGTPVRTIGNPPAVIPRTFFSDDSRFLVIQGLDDPMLHVFSVPDGRVVRTIPNDNGRLAVGASVITMWRNEKRNVLIRSWPFTGGDPVTLGRSDSDSLWDLYANGNLHSSGSSIIFPRDAAVYRQAVGDPMRSPELLWNVGEKVLRARLLEPGETLSALAKERLSLRFSDGTVRSIEGASLGAGFRPLAVDIKASKVVLSASTAQVLRYFVWDLDALLSSAPPQLRWPTSTSGITAAAVHPEGEWVATSGLQQVALWPLKQPYPRLIPRTVGGSFSAPLLFTPDSKHLLSCGNQSGLNRWSVTASQSSALVLDLECLAQAIDRGGANVIVGDDRVFFASLAGGPARILPVGGPGKYLVSAAFAPAGEIAAVYIKENKESTKRVVQIINLRSGNINALPIEGTSAQNAAVDEFAIRELGFASDGMLYSAGNGGIRRWDVGAGKCQTFRAAGTARMAISGSGRYILAALGEGHMGQTGTVKGDLILFDVQSGLERRITTHGSEFRALAIDQSGEIIGSKDAKSVIRIGKASGAEPHLLDPTFGVGPGLAISPDQKWVASNTAGNIALWPMPDLSKPPLHTLPHDQLMAKLHELTNLRAVADPSSSTGYKVEVGPFPGWKDVPKW